MAFVLATGACTLPDLDRDHGQRVVWRLIEEDPGEIFSRQLLFETREVESIDFDSPESLQAWQLNIAPEEYSLLDRKLEIRTAEKRYVSLIRKWERDAGAIDALEIRVRGLTSEPVFLDWAPPGEPFAKERQLQLQAGEELPDGFRAYRFDLANHPQWEGRIDSIRLALFLPPSRHATVDRLVILQESIKDAELTQATQAAYKFALGGDFRNGRLSLPGVALEGALIVPPAAELVFGLGLLGQTGGDVAHVIRLESEGETHQLFAETLPDDATGWYQRKISLADWQGREVRLIFETEKADLDPKHTLPLWGYPKVLAREDPVARQPNVLLISIDTLRADHMSVYGYERPTTPRLAAWARSATVFETAVAAAPWTLPSHTSMLTGLDALRHGVSFPQDLFRPELTLADVLRREGYTTLAVTGGGYVHPRYGFARGFERYFGNVSMGLDKELEQGIALARHWFEEEAGHPVLLFFHTYEVHNPFRPRQPYFTELTGRREERVVDVEIVPTRLDDGFMDRRRLRFTEDIGRDDVDSAEAEAWARDLYDSGIAYTDALVSEFLRDIERLDPSRPTLVILTSDHGELFGEHDLVNHVSLYDGNLLVPLIIDDPQDRGAGRRIVEQVRSIDIFPTVLDLLGMDPPAAVDGVSLVPLMEDGVEERSRDAELAWSYAPSSNYGVSLRGDNRYKYLFLNSAWDITPPLEAFYDLRQDPEETVSDLSREELARLRELTESALQERLAGLRIRISNRDGSEPLRGELAGRQLQRNRVKALRVDQPRLPLAESARLDFSIPPGEEVLLAIAGHLDTPLRLKIESPAGPPFERTIDPAKIDNIWRARPEKNGWLAADVDLNNGDGIFVWWHRREAAEAPRVPEIDPELQKQLQALGYLDG